MKNKYDDAVFFEKYSALSRSVEGLAGAGEWETLKSMLPEFNGKRVLDLGCGFGWHFIICRLLRRLPSASIGRSTSTERLCSQWSTRRLQRMDRRRGTERQTAVLRIFRWIGILKKGCVKPTS